MNDEIDQLMAVMAEAFDPYWNEAWTRRQVIDSLQLPTTRYLLQPGLTSSDESQPNRAAGFLMSRGALDEEELLLVAVHPEFRRQGLGKSLVERFVAEARQRGTRRIFLEMRANNSAAQFYESLGFKPIGRRKDYYRNQSGGRIDAITMTLEV